MKKNVVLPLAQGAVIAALYAALTLAVAPISYGMLQFRVSEALCILPVFMPAAIPGLLIGCMIANAFGVVMGQAFPLDILVGSMATLIGALLTRKFRGLTVKGIPFLSFSFPVLLNALLVGGELTYYFQTPLLPNMLWVGLGELVVCFGLGVPLFMGLRRFLS